jgi:hypothetical protein
MKEVYYITSDSPIQMHVTSKLLYTYATQWYLIAWPVVDRYKIR